MIARLLLIVALLVALVPGSATAGQGIGHARRFCLAHGGTWVNRPPFPRGCYYRVGQFTLPSGSGGVRYPIGGGR